MIRETRGEKIFNVFNCIILGIFAFSTLYPFLYTLSISLSTTKEATRIGLHLYPREVSFMAYSMVLKNGAFYQAYANTIFRTVVGTLLALLVTSMYAYALSRKGLPNRRLYSAILLFTMLFSGGQIPTYINLKQLNLLNSLWVYILPNLIAAYNTIIARSYFQSLPESLNESAKIDGAGEFRIFFSIILPLSKPIIMTLALWIAVFHWNAWYDAMMFVTDNNKIALQAYLLRIIQENNSDLISQGVLNPDILQYTPETVKSATIIVSIVPILMLYPFIQKYFIKGIMLGAVKG